MSDKPTTLVGKIIVFFFNRPAIAGVVVILLAVAFSADLIGKLYAVFGLISDADQHYAQEIADEYYVLLDEFECECEAKSLRGRIKALSVDALEYELARDKKHPINVRHVRLVDRHRNAKKLKENNTWRTSTDIGIGFSPDQVFYCRSDHKHEVWIVGLDLQVNQGEAIETAGRLNEIKTTIQRLLQSTDADATELQKTAKELMALLNQSRRVKYFDAIEYKATNGLPLVPR